jgi:hypothetical protein
MVRLSDGRDWHKIQSEYQPRFSIRWFTVFNIENIKDNLKLVLALHAQNLLSGQVSPTNPTLNNCEMFYQYVCTNLMDCCKGFFVLFNRHLES